MEKELSFQQMVLEQLNIHIKKIECRHWPYTLHISLLKMDHRGFPDGAVVENLPANAGDMGSSPGLGRSHMLRSN